MKNYRLPKSIENLSNPMELFTIHRAILQELSLDEMNHVQVGQENLSMTIFYEWEPIKQELLTRYQKKREEWRESYPAMLKRLREQVIVLNDIDLIQQEMTAGYQALLKKMLAEAMSLLGEPPCTYGWFGVGSYSRGEVLPYSDVEYLWLFEDTSLTTRHYFDVLNQLIGFQIRLLDEPGGFHPDQYPEMRIIEGEDCTWTLPKTMDEIAEGLVASCKSPEGVYTQILSSLQGHYIAGEEGLWSQYLQKMKTYHDTLHQAKKIKYATISEVCREILFVSVQDYERTWQAQSETPQQYDVKEGYAFFLTYLAVMLKLHFGVEGQGSVATFQALIAKNHIDAKMGEKIIEAWRQVQFLRFRTQSFYQDGRHDFSSTPSEGLYCLNVEEEHLLKQIHTEVIQPIYRHLGAVKRIEKKEALKKTSKGDSSSSESGDPTVLLTCLAEEITNYQAIPFQLLVPRLEPSLPQKSLRQLLKKTVQEKDIPLIAWLLELGANGKEPDMLDITPMRQVLRWSESVPNSAKQVWQHLLKAKGNPEECSNDRALTLLDEAMEKDLPQTFVVLCQLGAGRQANVERLLRFLETHLKPSKQSFANETRQAINDCIPLLTQQNHLLAWRMALLGLLNQDLPSSQLTQSIEVEGAITGKGVLTPQVMKQLFNNRGEILQANSYGRRQVAKITVNQQTLYVKFYPELPGMEEAMRTFAWQLFGYGTSQSELFRFVDKRTKKANSYSVLLSHQVAGDNLQVVFNEGVEKSNLKLAELDSYQLSQFILLTLLTHPEDGKPDNYILSPYINTEGKNSYQLVGIDNDHALVDAFIQEKDNKKVQVKTIVLCLEQMKEALHPKAIAEFIALHPEVELHQWLSVLVLRQRSYEALFQFDERERLLKEESVTQIPIPPKSMSKLYERWERIKESLQSNPQISAIELLKRSEPLLGARYQEVFDQHRDPLARFHAIASPSYFIPRVGQYKTLVTSRQLLKTQAIPEKELIQANSMYGPEQAIAELKQAAKESQLIDSVLLQVQQGDLYSFEALLLNKTREAVLAQLDWSLLTPIQQKNLLKQMTEQGGFRELTFTNADALTEEILKKIVKASIGLQRLTLINTPLIGKQVSELLIKYGASLERLVLSSLLQLLDLSDKNNKPDQTVVLPQLKVLQLLRCDQLDGIRLDMPTLKVLIVEALPQLKKCEILNAKNLQQLTLSYCAQLTTKAVTPLFKSAEQLLPRQVLIEECPQIQGWILGRSLLKQNANITCQDLGIFLEKPALNLEGMALSETVLWNIAQASVQLLTSVDELKLDSESLSAYSLGALLYHDTPLKMLRITWACFNRFKGHDDDVICVTELKSGQLISGSWDNTLKLWDVNTVQCLKTYEGHNRSVTCVTELKSGQFISGSWDDTLKLWDVDTGQCLRTYEGHNRSVTCVTELKSGQFISGSWDDTLKLWDVDTGQCLRTYKGHDDRVTCVTALKSGQFISGSGDKTLKLWDADTGQCLRTYEGHSNSVTCVTELKSGQFISGSYGLLKLWDADTGECLRTYKGHDDGVACVTELKSGQFISGSWDNTLKLWDVDTGQCLRTVKTGSIVKCVAELKNGHIVSGCDDGRTLTLAPTVSLSLEPLLALRQGFSLMIARKTITITPHSRLNQKEWAPFLKLYDINLAYSNEQPNTLHCKTPNDLYKLLCLFFSLRPQRIYWPEEERTILEEEALIQLQSFAPAWVEDVESVDRDAAFHLPQSFAVDNERLTIDHIASSFTLSTLLYHLPEVKTLHITEGKCIKRFKEEHNGSVDCVTELKSGQLISGSYNTLKLWDVDTGQCLRTYEGSGWVTCVTALKSGQFISGSYGLLKLWDADTGQCLRTYEERYEGHRSDVTCVTELKSGQFISGSDDKTFKLWEADTGKSLRTYKGHGGSVTCVIELKSGQFISGSYDKTLKLWDVDTGECLRTYKEHSGSVTCVIELKSGQFISGSDDKTLKLWDVDTGQCLTTYKGHSDGVICVTELESGQFISGSYDKTLKFWDADTGQCLKTIDHRYTIDKYLALLPSNRFVSRFNNGFELWHHGQVELSLAFLSTLREIIILEIKGLGIILTPFGSVNPTDWRPCLAYFDIQVTFTNGTLMCDTPTDLYRMLCLLFSLRPKVVYWEASERQVISEQRLKNLLLFAPAMIENVKDIEASRDFLTTADDRKIMEDLSTRQVPKKHIAIRDNKNKSEKEQPFSLPPLNFSEQPIKLTKKKHKDHSSKKTKTSSLSLQTSTKSPIAISLFPDNVKYTDLFKPYRKDILDFIEGKNQQDVIDLVLKLFKDANTALLKAILIEAIEYGKVSLGFGAFYLHRIQEQLSLINKVKAVHLSKKINLNDEQVINLLGSYQEQLKQELDNNLGDRTVLQQQNDLVLILLTGLKRSAKQGKEFNEKLFFKQLNEQQVYQTLSIPLFDPTLSVLTLAQTKSHSLKALWTTVSDFLLSYFAEEDLKPLAKTLTEQGDQASLRYQELVKTVHHHLSLKNKQGWKEHWLYGQHYASLKCQGHSGVVLQGFFHLTHNLTSERFVVLDDFLQDVSALLGSTYFSSDKPMDSEKTLCLDANYQSSTSGATADGLGHFASFQMNQAIQQTAYRTVKLLVRYANLYQDSRSFYADLPTLFAHVGKAVKYGVQHPEEAGTACAVVTKVFTEHHKKKIVAGGIGDCMVMTWTPSTCQLAVLIKPRQYNRGFQYTPMSLSDAFSGEMFQRAQLLLPADSFVIRMTDGAWEMLPHERVNGFDESCKKEYFEYSLTVELEQCLTQFTEEHPDAKASDYRAYLQKLIQMKVSAKKALLLDYQKAVHNQLSHFSLTGQTVKTSSLNEFLLWAEQQAPDFYELLQQGLTLLNYDLNQIKTTPLTDFIQSLEHIQLGDDLALHVEGVAQQGTIKEATIFIS